MQTLYCRKCDEEFRTKKDRKCPNCGRRDHVKVVDEYKGKHTMTKWEYETMGRRGYGKF